MLVFSIIKHQTKYRPFTLQIKERYMCFRIKAYITKATKRCTNPCSLELQYISDVIHAAIDHGRVSS